MKNTQELRVVLSGVMSGLLNGTVTARDAGAAANIAGKIISSAKAQLEQYELQKERPNIKFLIETDDDIIPKPIKAVNKSRARLAK
jgi:hypothetical protein